MERFDVLECRAARTMGEADYFWKHRQTRTIAARLDLPPTNLMDRIRKILDRVLMRTSL